MLGGFCEGYIWAVVTKDICKAGKKMAGSLRKRKMERKGKKRKEGSTENFAALSFKWEMNTKRNVYLGNTIVVHRKFTCIILTYILISLMIFLVIPKYRSRLCFHHYWDQPPRTFQWLDTNYLSGVPLILELVKLLFLFLWTSVFCVWEFICWSDNREKNLFFLYFLGCIQYFFITIII